jgi:hypothetical protein
MSSQGSPSLDLDVRSRRTERRIACVAIAAAFVIPCFIEPLLPMQMALLSIMAGSLVTAGLWRSGWIGRHHRIDRVTWLADGRWLLRTQAGANVEAELSHTTRRGQGFAWLRWRAPHRHSLLLVQGDLAGAELRRLLVRLGIDRLARPAAFPLDGDSARQSMLATLKSSIQRLVGRPPSGLIGGSAGRQSWAAWHLPVARTRRR